MKNFFTIIIAAMVATTSFSQQDQLKGLTMENNETEILEIVKKWNQSFDQNDPDTYFEYIHEDLTLFIASSPYRIDGKADDREEFEWSLSKGRTRVSLFQELQPKVQLLSSTSALVTYHTRGVYGPEGQEQTVYLKETNVLIKENDQWKIIHIHVSR